MRTNEFKSGLNWLVWEEKHKPMSCLTGKLAGWNRNLASYNDAMQFCLNNPKDKFKLGYCFTQASPFVGLDLDACRNPQTGEIADWADEFMRVLSPSVVLSNISVSGTGVKLILRCDETLKRGVKYFDGEGHGDHEPQAELFCDSKYFALTDFDTFLIRDDAKSVDTEALSRLMGYDVSDTTVELPKASGGETTPEELRDLLSKLDIMEFQSRHSWLKIMQASHHATGGSGAGKEVFKTWSAGDEATYCESDIERDWGSLKANPTNPVTVGTIMHFIAPEDRPQKKLTDEFKPIKVRKTRMLPWLLDEGHRTHAKVLEQFAQDVRTVRFVPEWSSWIAYIDGVWMPDASGAIVHSMVLDFFNDMRDRIPDGDAEECSKALMFVSRLGNWSNTNAVLKQMKGARTLTVSASELNKNNHLLNFTNGTYDLDTNTFRQHDLEDFCTLQCTTNYVEGQTATKWIEVVSQIFGGDQELVSYVRRLLGKSIYGGDANPTFNIFFGDGCNGKSTVVQTIGSLLGGYSCSLPSEMLDSRKEMHPQYYAQLFGRRYAMFAEMENGVPLAEGTVKKLTSSDEIEARRMYENSWTFTPTHTSIICTNHKPKIKGSDTGIWRRLRLIPFEVDLSDRVDLKLAEKLEREKAGIANWLIQGYREYVEQGVGECAAVTEATREYREMEDEFGQMARELFEPSLGEDLSAAEAHAHYMRNGGRYGRKTFITEMQRKGYAYVRKSVNGKRAFTFADIKVVSEFGEI